MTGVTRDGPQEEHQPDRMPAGLGHDERRQRPDATGFQRDEVRMVINIRPLAERPCQQRRPFRDVGDDAGFGGKRDGGGHGVRL